MTKLFTKSDVERACRLATLHALVERDPEAAIARAVADVADEAPPYYSEETVKLMLQFVLAKENVDKEFEEALQIVRSC